jgi:hypothetical protein
MDKDNYKRRDLEFCAITEQGDLGLGAEVLGYSDQKVLNEAVQKNKYNSSDDKDKK